MADNRDVTGVWYGSWTADHPQVAPGSFIATFEESGGSVDGTITERHPRRSGLILRAAVIGHRAGATLRFIKQYDGAGGWDHAVRYAGQVNGEGTEISGRWTLPGYAGSFVMQREKFDVEELEEEERVGEPTDALPIR